MGLRRVAALLSAAVVLSLCGVGHAQTYRHKWTTTADFDEGQQVNVNADEVPDQLQLELGGIATPYLWVSNSGSNTVSRISTVSGRVLSVTDILPFDGFPTASGPSRTAVDLDFNCWVTLRFETNGRAIKISSEDGRVLGQTQYVGARTRGIAINGQGEVWISSSERSVRPTNGYGWSKVDPNTFRETLQIDQDIPSYGLVIDPFGRVFSTTSWLGDRSIQRVDGTTGAVEQRWRVDQLAEANIYGLSVDIDGDLWGTYWRENFTGTGADNTQIVWIDGNYACPNGAAECSIGPGTGIRRNIDVRQVVGAVGGVGPYQGRGIAVDANGFVWAVINDVAGGDWRTAPSYAVKLDRATGEPILAVPTGMGSVGITPDAQGFIWVVNFRGGGANLQDFTCPNGHDPAVGGTVTKLRSSDGSSVATYPTCGLEPYTYSDMAGYTLRSVTLRSGSWRVRHDSGRPDLEWARIDWLSQVPVDGQLRVRVRVAEDEASLATASFVDVTPGGPIPGRGRWIEIEAFFFTRNDFIGPVMEEVTVSSVCLPVAETCDGFDNDCDGEVDNDNPGGGQPCTTPLAGACRLGERRCLNGDYQCVSVAVPSQEECNGVDDNCDGSIDEGVSNLCGTCGPAPEEICDGQDNDCDGETDEGVSNLCGTCGPTPEEVCDGQDNDCDGVVDEGVTNLCGTCGDTPEEVCDGLDNDCDGIIDEGVTNSCGACEPVVLVEICDGLDNDCNGAIDDGVLNACGTCGPTPEEVCDGQDNDCDGEIDEDVLNACGFCGETREEVCNGVDDDCDGDIDEGVSNRCGGCGPEPEELCNGLDDNCDGTVDEGVTNRCGTCGVIGEEVCDGQDNDCDGEVDEGVTNRCGTCGSLGLDVCDGVDNDCDGELDEDPDCVDGRACVRGECASRCAASECPAGFYCASENYCLIDRCLGRTCSTGERCIDGDCLDDNQVACREVSCDASLVCVGGECVTDPCAAVDCPQGEACWLGVCEDAAVNACRGVACAAGEVCDNGTCVPDPCRTVVCDPGMRCEAGACVDACEGVACSTGFVCRLGSCTPDLCFGVVCAAGQTCDRGNCIYPGCVGVVCPEGQQCGPDGCEPLGSCGGTFCDAGETCVAGVCVSSGDANNGGDDDAGTGAPEPNAAVRGGATLCSTAAVPVSTTSRWGLAALALLGLAAMARRR